MFYALVTFKSNPVPQLFGVTHISHAARLATMADEEWVSPAIANGSATEHECGAVRGGGYKQGIVNSKIEAYRP